MATAEIGSFDDIQDVEWIDWKKGKVTVRFETSEFLKGINSFDKTSYTFSVTEDGAEKLMGVTSKRLMLKLKEYHPLEGKTFSIKRIGANMETDYDLTEIVEQRGEDDISISILATQPESLMEEYQPLVVAMIHTNPADAAHVGAFHGDVIEGLTGSVRAIEDNGQSYIMILIPYPVEMVEKPIYALKHGY